MYAVVSIHTYTDTKTYDVFQENHDVRPFADLAAAQQFAISAKERFDSSIKQQVEAEDASSVYRYEFAACRIYDEKGDLLFHVRADDFKLVDSKADRVVDL